LANITRRASFTVSNPLREHHDEDGDHLPVAVIGTSPGLARAGEPAPHLLHCGREHRTFERSIAGLAGERERARVGPTRRIDALTITAIRRLPR
jgi:hypothetical protein